MRKVTQYGLFFAWYGPLFGLLLLSLGIAAIKCYPSFCVDAPQLKLIFGFPLLGLFFCHLIGAVPAALTGVIASRFSSSQTKQALAAGAAGYVLTVAWAVLFTRSAPEVGGLLFGLIGAGAGVITSWLKSKRDGRIRLNAAVTS